jgi:small multidrug resistance pump
MSAYIHLFIAILFEVAATSALKSSAGFTRWGPSVVVVLGYCGAFYFLSHALRTMPTGVAYGIWSGMGTFLVAVIGWVGFKQRLDLPAILGLTLIVSGVVVMNVFSKSVSH